MSVEKPREPRKSVVNLDERIENADWPKRAGDDVLLRPDHAGPAPQSLASPSVGRPKE